MRRGNELAYAELEREWLVEKNIPLRFADVSAGSHKRVWWRCGSGHEWQATVKSRAEGSGCPVCANRQVLRGVNDLASTHPWLTEQWDKDKNGGLGPEDVVAGSHRKVWWRCGCGHEWETMIYLRVQGRAGCPYCAGKRIKAGENDLATHYPELAAQWDYERNGELKPDEVAPASNRRVWWRCELGHVWQAMIGSRTQMGSGCPYCKGRRVLEGFNDLASQYPKLALEWYGELNGGLQPNQVTTGSSKRVWWRCEEGHVWHAAIYSRTGSQKCGCPVCAGTVRKKLSCRSRNV